MTLIIIATTFVIIIHKNWKLDAVDLLRTIYICGYILRYTHMTRHYDCVHKFNYNRYNVDLSLVNSAVAHQSVN